MRRMTGKKKKLLEALEKSLGVVTPAVKAVGISRRTYYNWLDNDPEFKKAVEDLPEIALDFAEAQLYKQMKAGNVAAIIYFMKTKGRRRGFGERPTDEEQQKDLFGSLPLEKRLELIKVITGK